jgi:glycosyltransferase involved in cell wall biosynthesis
MKVDILFVDPVCARPYTNETLESESLGGSESSTIRLAEGFASKGHSVLISQHWELPLHTSPNGVQYGGPHWAVTAKPKNVIFIRSKGIWDKFPDSNKFTWLHDASEQEHNNLSSWVPGMIEHNVLAVAVSDWHVRNVSHYAPGIPITRIYSPMDETCFQPAREYDKNQLVWLASPHKGLKEGLEIFNEILSIQPQMKLVVFNPGYYTEDVGTPRRVVFLPKQKRSVLRSVLSQSLCMFYPTEFEETFGLIAAESNALGVPVATYGRAALAESSVGPFAKDRADLINQILEWRENRPVITGQTRFRFSKIYPEWLKVLKL